MSWKSFAATGTLFCAIVCAGTAAAEEPDGVPVNTEESVAVRPFLTLESRGSFRLRGDLFGNAHLNDAVGDGQYLSAFLPPASLLSEGEEPPPGPVVGGGNMRFRWEPTLRIDSGFAIHAQIDALDNLVLGSTPSYSPGLSASPLGFFAESQESPSAGINSGWDAVRVKRAWAELTFFHLLEIEVGRRPDHWGLGMLYNDGRNLDSDYGDNVDGIAFAAAIPGVEDFRVRLSWDFMGEGSVLGHPGVPSAQAWDAEPLDDADRVVLDLSYVPTSAASRARRDRQLHEDRRPVWTAGWRNALRMQDYATDVQPSWPDSDACAQAVGEGEFQDQSALSYDCIALFPRDGFIWTTDAWFRMDWRPAPGRRFLLEGEFAGVLLSEVASVQWQDEKSSKEFWAGGGVLRTRFEEGPWRVGLDLIAATGDDVPSFGTWDRSHFFLDEAQFNDLNDLASLAVKNNDVASAFHLHPSFIMDMLLFREVIGTVTNAMVARSWVGLDAWYAGLHLGARLDGLFAAAMFPEGTPGRARNLGFEADARVFFEVHPMKIVF